MPMKSSEFKAYFSRLSETIDKLDIQVIEQLVELLLRARDRENTVFIFGNGGSAATASHITGDFLKGISYELDKRFRVMCLSDNIPGLTALSNDLGYEDIFVEQLKVFLKKDDLVIGISGSGNSMNVVKAMEFARKKGARTVAMCGYKGGKIRELADLVIHVPVHDMEITEDIHIIIFHAVKQVLIKKLKGENYSMGDIYDARLKE
jgi:D-sedoheptulose 7-phosphate isomerase